MQYFVNHQFFYFQHTHITVCIRGYSDINNSPNRQSNGYGYLGLTDRISPAMLVTGVTLEEVALNAILSG